MIVFHDEKIGLSIKDKKRFDYKNLRLADDYEYESEEEEKKQTDNKQPLKKPTKIDAKEFNELINKEETDISSELFRKRFNFQRPSEVLNAVFTTNNRSKNEKLVNGIKSGLSNLKNQI